jgi:hypothetical protein
VWTALVAGLVPLAIPDLDIVDDAMDAVDTPYEFLGDLLEKIGRNRPVKRDRPRLAGCGHRS